MKIGLFDSGIGGTTILESVKQILPQAEYHYIADSKNCPYGEKSDEELEAIVSKNVEALRDWGADLIVIACNTATTRCLSFLRDKYPEIPFVGTEPAIKAATNTTAKRILVMATPGTIESERTKMLLEEYQKPGQKIELLTCLGLADVIEKYYASHQLSPIIEHLNKLLHEVNIDPEVVVLGCTHYSLIKPEIQTFFKAATIIDGNQGVAKQVAKLAQKIAK